MGHLPSINKVYSLFVQEERQIVTPIDESKLLAFLNGKFQGIGFSSHGRYGRGFRSFNGQGRGNRVYTHYGITNNTIDTCFKKHVYPPHWQQQGLINNVPHDESHDDKVPRDNS